MNYSKQFSNVNRSVTQSRDVVKHMLFLYFVRGIKYMQNVVVFHSFRVCGRTIHQSLTDYGPRSVSSASDVFILRNKREINDFELVYGVLGKRRTWIAVTYRKV